MTDRQIRCFLALYETLNFSAAARQPKNSVFHKEPENSGSDGRSCKAGLLSGISSIVTKPLGKVNKLIEKIHN
mgnify:CR=1